MNSPFGPRPLLFLLLVVALAACVGLWPVDLVREASHTALDDGQDDLWDAYQLALDWGEGIDVVRGDRLDPVVAVRALPFPETLIPHVPLA